MKILSLFDGISIAQQAFKELGFEVEYYASEIDKYAIQITKKNHPKKLCDTFPMPESKLNRKRGEAKHSIGNDRSETLTLHKNMKEYKIIRIDPEKQCPDGKFIRVHFEELETKKWLKTDLVKGFRNFGAWKPLLKVDNILYDLAMKDGETINADSSPKLRKYPFMSLEDEEARKIAEENY